MTLIAYHNNKSEKAQILKQLRAHAKADEIVKGRYWSGGKGCAIGCTIHSGDHAEYEPRFGIPIMLATLEDKIFEGLPNAEAKAWPLEFMGAIRPGADLSLVGWKFLHWLVTDEKVNPGIKHPLVKGAVKQCADVLLPLTRGEPRDSAARAAVTAAVTAARLASHDAAARAASTANSAVESAAAAYRAAASASESAAESAADSAAAAAYSVASAAYCAARAAAYSANSAAYSTADGESGSAAAYSRMAKKLLSLLKAAPQTGDKKERR